jgi:hypothetical protein
MITITSENNILLKTIADPQEPKKFGLHSLFGFISDDTVQNRENNRKRHGLASNGTWLSTFLLAPTQGGWEIKNAQGCNATLVHPSQWVLETPIGKFTLGTGLGNLLLTETKEEKNSTPKIALFLFLLCFGFYFLVPKQAVEVAPQVIEPVMVKITPQVQKTVKVPVIDAVQVPKELANQKVLQEQAKRRAVAQNLGFLSMLGKKDLNKALGGMPTSIQDASPGAGAGGKEGSGGELLVGLGKGVTRTTVGNSGVAGLGGIGTKGAGGGAGGYGTAMVGSGDGKAISAMPLSNDIILEGGLDKAVIQATIAKYIAQVRACYEQGLRKNPGITGTVTMAFEINPAGNLNFSKVAKSSLGNAEVEGCISARMMTWLFPKPLGGVNVKVSYPFLLRPVNS